MKLESICSDSIVNVRYSYIDHDSRNIGVIMIPRVVSFTAEISKLSLRMSIMASQHGAKLIKLTVFNCVNASILKYECIAIVFFFFF